MKNTYENLKEAKTVDFEMFTPAGNRAMHGLAKRLTRFCLGKKRITKEDLIERATKGIAEVEKKHGEAWDTEPRYHLAYFTRRALTEADYSWAEEIDSYTLYN